MQVSLGLGLLTRDRVCSGEAEALEIREKFVMGRTAELPASRQVQQSFGSWINPFVMA